MDRLAGMTGPEHFLAGEHALEESEMIDFDQYEKAEDARGDAVMFAARAHAHFAAAQAAALGAMVASEQERTGQAGADWATLLNVKVDSE